MADVHDQPAGHGDARCVPVLRARVCRRHTGRMAGTDGGEVLVLLLRGVNVNGITVRSAPLRACIAALEGVGAARTLLASGNVVVRSSLSPRGLKDAAEQALRREFGYQAWVVVLTQRDLAAVLPDAERAATDVLQAGGYSEQHTYLTFATDPAALDAVEDAAPGPLLRPAPGVLVWRCPRGASTTDPTARLLARPALRSTTTTRNLRTVQRLAVLQP